MFPVIDQLTMDDVDAFFDSWAEFPPTHVSVAIFAGTFRKPERRPMGMDLDIEKDPVMKQLLEKLKSGRK